MVIAIVAGIAILGLVFLGLSIRAFLWERWGGMVGHACVGVVCLLLASLLGVTAFALLAYRNLTGEQEAAEVQIRQQEGEQKFSAMVIYPNKTFQVYDLAGDEWQIDARMLQWKGVARMVGLDAMYRFERISGRYRDINKEKTAARTVHAMVAPEPIDFFDLVGKAGPWLPFVDAYYGNAVYLPMVNNAIYDVSVSPTGLVARPRSDEAKRAVANWK